MAKHTKINDNNEDLTQEIFKDLNQSAYKSEQFVEKNKNILSGLFGVIILAIVGYYMYNNFYKAPREKEASEEMFYAKKYMEQDSLKLAINGDGQNSGFVDISSEYSGTKAGNLANYYLGAIYLKTNKPKEAIDYLSKFSSDNKVATSQANGMIGDAFMELNQPKDALDSYTKSTSLDNNYMTPIYLKKAAFAAIALKDWKKAGEFFKTIKEKYPKSVQASEADKYIARAGL